jgi:hypothetical protein
MFNDYNIRIIEKNSLILRTQKKKILYIVYIILLVTVVTLDV